MSNRGTAGNVFSITTRGFKASVLVYSGEYDRVDDAITDKNFPIEEHTLNIRQIELVEFDHDPSSSEEVLTEFARRELERPTYEDALTFGVSEHHEEQRKHPVVFLHEPVKVRVLGGGRVVVLYGDAQERNLGLGRFGGWWTRNHVFAGIRK